MKLSLNEKTLIIIGVFAICLLFLNNLNNDDKNFTKNIIEEESRDLFQNTSSSNKNNKSNNKEEEQTNTSKEEGTNSSQLELEEVEQVEEKEERETAKDKYDRLNIENENKVTGIKAKSDKYIEDIQKLYDRNKEEKKKIQEGIITNLITGEKIIKDKDGEDKIKIFDSYLQYNGTLLRNSLLNTASTF